jgi:hypothetical protein
MYENGKMRSVKTVLRMWAGGLKGNEGGVNLTKINCEHLCKCPNVPQNNNIIQTHTHTHTHPTEDEGFSHLPEHW